MKQYKCFIAKQMYREDINKALDEMVKEGYQLLPFTLAQNILIFEREITKEQEITLEKH